MVESVYGRVGLLVERRATAIVALVVLFCDACDARGDWKDAATPLALLVLLLCIVAGPYFMWKASQAANREEEQRRQRLEELQIAYNEALDALSATPADPRLRVLCLERGRAYYAATIPDTFTVHLGQNSYGVSDFMNNTAGREARINSDIEARIGHLKLR